MPTKRDPSCRPDGESDSRVGLLGALDRRFRRLPTADELARLDDVEDYLQAVCQTRLLSLLNRRRPSDRRSLGNVVDVNGQPYILKMQPAIDRSRRLIVLLQDVREPKVQADSYVRFHDALPSSIGKFDQVCAALPTIFGTEWCDRAWEAIVDVYQTGYFWLDERVRDALSELENEFEQQTLRRLQRQIFIHGRGALSDKIWLVMVAEGRVYYAVDADVSRRVMTSAISYAEMLQEGPASITAGLLANSIPLSVSFSKTAIETGETIEMSLAAAPYQDHAEDFQTSQGAIYEKEMALTPLVGDKRAFLLAAYPSAIKSEVVDVLVDARTDLEQYLSEARARVRPALTRLGRKSDLADAAEVVGRFAGAFLRGGGHL